MSVNIMSDSIMLSPFFSLISEADKSLGVRSGAAREIDSDVNSLTICTLLWDIYQMRSAYDSISSIYHCRVAEKTYRSESDK
jgi:hypothetical protein